MALRCLIIDDNAAFLAAARSLLEREGLTVVGVAANGTEGLNDAVRLAPDVVLVDVDLGQESGFSVARRLNDADGLASPSLILISTHPHDDFAELVEQSPAIGFIAKSELSARAIQELLEGQGDPITETPER